MLSSVGTVMFPTTAYPPSICLMASVIHFFFFFFYTFSFLWKMLLNCCKYFQNFNYNFLSLVSFNFVFLFLIVIIMLFCCILHLLLMHLFNFICQPTHYSVWLTNAITAMTWNIIWSLFCLLLLPNILYILHRGGQYVVKRSRISLSLSLSLIHLRNYLQN